MFARNDAHAFATIHRSCEIVDYDAVEPCANQTNNNHTEIVDHKGSTADDRATNRHRHTNVKVHKLINNLGAKLGVNDSWAGSRVHNNASSNSGDLGPDACMASITRITNLGANGTPDLIFFYGGTNDAGKNVQLGTFDSSINHKVDLTATTWATFADAYAAAIMRMQYFYPDAKIIALTPMWVKSYYPVSRMNDFAEVIVSICDYFGVPVIDLRKCGINSNNIDYTLGDGIHPNAEGMKQLADAVIEELKRDDLCS